MPQLFHVLKCYKCSVFQVHQTKKSNKWECKLCGEKQSMKRHYGLGTGKECRLHVQKLNGIWGRKDENNDTAKINESSDEEIQVKHDAKIPNIKPTNLESKWSEFVDKVDDNEDPVPYKSMYFGNAEVVLDVPTKRRKFTKPKIAKCAEVSNTYPSKSHDFNNYGNLRESPSPPPIQFYETQLKNIQNKRTEVAKLNEDQFFMPDDITSTDPNKQHLTTFVPHKVDKKSKWAQFADELEEKSLSYAERNKNDTVTAYKSNNELNDENISINTLNNIFSLCDENDLDDVLNV